MTKCEYPILAALEDKELVASIRKAHIEQYSLLSKVSEVLQEHDIPYALLGGSHLGQLRIQETLFYDDDVDLITLREHVERLESEALIKAYTDKGITLVKEGMDKKEYVYHFVNRLCEKYPNQMLQMPQVEYYITIGGMIDYFGEKIHKGGFDNENGGQLDIFVYEQEDEKSSLYCWPFRSYFDEEDFDNKKLVPFGPLIDYNTPYGCGKTTRHLKTQEDPESALEAMPWIITNWVDNPIIEGGYLKGKSDLPYTLQDCEVEAMKEFSFDITLEELT